MQLVSGGWQIDDSRGHSDSSVLRLDLRVAMKLGWAILAVVTIDLIVKIGLILKVLGVLDKLTL